MYCHRMRKQLKWHQNNLKKIIILFTDPGCYKLTKDETTLGDNRFNLSRFTDILNTATVSSNKDL